MVQDEEYIQRKNDFDKFYDNKLYPILKSNDNERQRYLKYFWILLFLAIVFYPMILSVLFERLKNFEDSSDMGWVMTLSGFVIMLVASPIYLYKLKVKPTIMNEFAGFFGDFEYEYERYLSDTDLVKSKLFKSYNNHKGDDYFLGTYKNVGITISEETLKNITYDSKNNKKVQTVFKGICVMLEMNKNFIGQTVVLDDKGIFNALNKISGMENIKLEDSRFEKLFEVYANDQIEARYLLTTAFMERILKLQDLYKGKNLRFSFIENKLLIAISTKENMFEANSFFKSNLNKKKVDIVFEQFYTIFSIVDILKLNHRLGM